MTNRRIEDRERRIYKDAHAKQFARIKHFPALTQQVTSVSTGENVILMQDSKPVDPILTARTKRMNGITSRIAKPDSVKILFI